MPSKCAICESETAGTKLCSPCGYHAIADELLADPGLAEIRSRLGRALHWRYYLQAPCAVRTAADVAAIVGWYEARDPEEDERKAVDALAGVGAVADPFGVEVLHAVSRAIGLSHEEARAYIKQLEEGGIVRIERGGAVKPIPGTLPFPDVSLWVRCAERL
jgi:hypothetical protein